MDELDYKVFYTFQRVLMLTRASSEDGLDANIKLVHLICIADSGSTCMNMEPLSVIIEGSLKPQTQRQSLVQ